MRDQSRWTLPQLESAGMRAAALAVLGLAAVVYLRTMPPGLVGIGRGLWDSQETQAAGLTWGYLHPPGYPLQSLLAGLLAHSLGALPGVEPGWAVTWLSLLSVVVAAAFLYRVVASITLHSGAALLATVVFALSPGPWRTAITPEVYALNVALWALVFWLALRAGRAFSPRLDFWLGLALGLAAGHHRTAFLLLPASLLYVGLRRHGRLAWKHVLLGALLSVGVYLYLPLAHVWGSPMTPGDAASLSGFWELVSARAWSVFFHVPNSVGELASRLELVLDALTVELGLLGAGLGWLGWAWLLSCRPGRPDYLVLFGLPVAGLPAFAVVYQVPDVATMLGPLVLILCVGLGGLAAGVWELGAGAWPRDVPSGPHPLEKGDRTAGTTYRAPAILLAAAVGVGLMFGNFAAVDESGDRQGGAVIAELACELSHTPGEVWLTAESGYAGPLVTYVGERIGRPLVWANPWGAWDYLGALSQGHRVFLVNDMPGGWQHPEALKRLAGPGRYLLPTGSPDVLELVAEQPPGKEGGWKAPDGDYVALEQAFGPTLILRGYSWRRCSDGNHPPWRLTLFWEAREKIDQDWRVKAHLLAGDGRLLAQADSEHPVRGARPTSGWQPGQVIRDAHDFHLAPGAGAEGARAVVGLYQVVDGEFPSLAEVEIEVGR
jgi:hypothetical protein